LNRNLPLKPNGLFRPTQKIGQRMPWALRPIDHELAAADHVHQLNAGEYGTSGSARFEVEHRLGHSLGDAMILLEDVLLELNLDHKERHVAAGVDCIHGHVVGSALSIATLFRSPFAPIALWKKRFAAAMSLLSVSRKSRACAACR
jgi:hypothetical protein